jgi:hypothetical protein
MSAIDGKADLPRTSANARVLTPLADIGRSPSAQVVPHWRWTQEIWTKSCGRRSLVAAACRDSTQEEVTVAGAAFWRAEGMFGSSRLPRHSQRDHII